MGLFKAGDAALLSFYDFYFVVMIAETGRGLEIRGVIGFISGFAIFDGRWSTENFVKMLSLTGMRRCPARISPHAE